MSHTAAPPTTRLSTAATLASLKMAGRSWDSKVVQAATAATSCMQLPAVPMLELPKPIVMLHVSPTPPNSVVEPSINSRMSILETRLPASSTGPMVPAPHATRFIIQPRVQPRWQRQRRQRQPQRPLRLAPVRLLPHLLHHLPRLMV